MDRIILLLLAVLAFGQTFIIVCLLMALGVLHGIRATLDRMSNATPNDSR